MLNDNAIHLKQRDIEGTRTSKEWHRLSKDKITDPDGWDRLNYNYSFNEETITYGEFMSRLLRSTLNMSTIYEIQIDDEEQDIVEKNGNKIYEIEHIRTRNNSLWMELLKIALKYAPEEAKKVLKQINENDNAVSRLLKEIVDE